MNPCTCKNPHATEQHRSFGCEMLGCSCKATRTEIMAWVRAVKEAGDPILAGVLAAGPIDVNACDPDRLVRDVADKLKAAHAVAAELGGRMPDDHTLRDEMPTYPAYGEVAPHDRCTWERAAGGHGYPGRCVRPAGHEGDHRTMWDIPHAIGIVSYSPDHGASPTAVAFEATYVARELADAALNEHAHECPKCGRGDGFDCAEYAALHEQARTARASQLAAASASLAAWGRPRQPKDLP